MIVVWGVKRMDWKDREGSEDTRHEMKIAKWYDTGIVKRNGEILFFSARGQELKCVLNIQTETNGGSGKAHVKWKEKLSSFGTAKCGKEEQREQKKIPASNFTLGYSFSSKLRLNDRQ